MMKCLLNCCIITLYLLNFGPTSNVQARPCDILQSSIICSGDDIDDLSMSDLRHTLHKKYQESYFLQVMITETSLTSIPEHTFEDITFENLIIDGNQQLIEISEKAFAEQSIKTLYVISNSMLEDNGLYALTNRLHVNEAIDFTFNSLKEIPSFAFHQTPYKNTDSKQRRHNFQKLVLSHNKISNISSNAFASLVECSEIDLNENQISLIEPNAFNLTSHEGNKNIAINFSKNHLNSNSFEANFITLGLNQSLHLNFANNKFTELKQSLFEPLLKDREIMIDLSGNKINCDSVHWLNGNQNYLSKIKGIHC